MSVTATSKTTGSLNVGDSWEVGVSVRNSKGALVDATVSAVVTKPDANSTQVAVTVERVSTGKYRALYVLDLPGRHIATVSASGQGSESFAITAKAPTAKMPTLQDVRDYMLQSGLSYDDSQIEDALEAEMAAQDAVCKIGAHFPADLRDALLRRVHRNLAMRSIPLGVQQDEAGGIRIGTNDPEVRRLEGPYRKRVLG